MKLNTRRSLLAIAIGASLLTGCLDNKHASTQNESSSSVPYYKTWPKINSAIKSDATQEQFIASVLAQMTLEEKVGQMIQPDLTQVTPEEAAQYKLGSLLNGGGNYPNANKHSTAADWANESDKYYLAVKTAFDGRGFWIPFMWATDAVHGDNNVYGATLFPHNIGLGAAHDPDLIYKIGQATAQEIAATGLDWTFAPTVTTPRDDRWGRVYEGYSEDAEIVHAYAGKMVEGIQGSATDLKGDQHVISNVKHFVGDGGTLKGVDRGENHYSEDYLRNIHATGYFSGLDAGAQVVMASFNSWNDDSNYAIPDETTANHATDYNYKIHGSKYLIQDVLKQQMGFDGLVVSDWNGHQEVAGCSSNSCPAAVNAGIDIFMVTANADWKAFYQDVINKVKSGVIPQERIDDAVTRILRVKARAGLWDKPQPSLRSLAGKQEILGSSEHKALAREAVSKSLVLLKNNANTLPLSRNQKILLAGSAASDIQKQTGGWSLSWQGTGNTLDDFPGAQTVELALKDVIGANNVVTNIADMPTGGVALVVIGEDPYAEMYGDIKSSQTLEFAALKTSYKADLDKIKELKAAGFKVVTVFFSGRPLYVNDEINNSDAFVSAWLPGTEAGGITDVLFKNTDDSVNKPFTGKLSYTWPNKKCATTINKKPSNIPNYTLPDFEQALDADNVLFAYGYGLTNGETSTQDLNNLTLDDRSFGCDQTDPSNAGLATNAMEVFSKLATGDHVLRLGDPSNWNGTDSVIADTALPNIKTTAINYQHQYDAREVTFLGTGPAQIYVQTVDQKGIDRTSYSNAESTLQFDVKMHEYPSKSVNLGAHCEYPCLSEVKLTSVMNSLPTESWKTIKVPLACFSGLDFTKINTPFLLYTEGTAHFDLGNIRWVPKSVDAAADAVSCDKLQETLTPLDETPSNLFVGGTFSSTWNAYLGTWTAHSEGDWSPVDGLITTTVSGDEIDIQYADAPAGDKGLVFIQGDPQNLTNYLASGKLEFELYVDSYANNTTGLTVKMEGTKGTGPDHPLGAGLALGAWTPVSINLSDLGIDDKITSISKPFAILPAWGEAQGNVRFKVRNIRLVK